MTVLFEMYWAVFEIIVLYELYWAVFELYFKQTLSFVRCNVAYRWLVKSGYVKTKEFTCGSRTYSRTS